MRSHSTSWFRVIAVVIMVFCLASCSNNSLPVSVIEYSTKIVGSWEGKVGYLKETMLINSDGTFVWQLLTRVYFGKTKSQGEVGTARGTWKIDGTRIILTITGETNEVLKNRIAPSTIVTFKEGELVLKSDRGDFARFRRMGALSRERR